MISSDGAMSHPRMLGVIRVGLAGGGGVSASYVLSLVFKQNGERHKALHSHLLLGRSSLPLYEDLKKRFSSWAELWNSK